MYPSRFRYEAPRSLTEAIGLLADGGGEAKVLAGGQSLVPLMKLRFATPELLVDINNVGGLDYHREDPDGTLRIGALCRHAHLERSALLKGKQPVMAAGEVSSLMRQYRFQLSWLERLQRAGAQDHRRILAGDAVGHRLGVLHEHGAQRRFAAADEPRCLRVP